MKTVLMKSRTVHTNTDSQGQGALVVIQSDSQERIDTSKIYAEEAKQIYDFINSIFCTFTMVELRKLLPDLPSYKEGSCKS